MSSGPDVQPISNASINSLASPFNIPRIGFPVLMYDWNLPGSVKEYRSVSEIISTSACANHFGISERGWRPQNFTLSSISNFSLSGSNMTPPPTSHSSESFSCDFSNPAITFSRFCGTPMLPANMKTVLTSGFFSGSSMLAGSHCGIHSASRPVSSLILLTYLLQLTAILSHRA